MNNVPKVLVFPITYRCNSKCIMCTIWQRKLENELTLKEISDLFNDPTLSENVESINITGGEPTLREDFNEIIEVIVEKSPKLREIGVNSNGFNTENVLEKVLKAAELMSSKKKRLNVYISLDGLREIHDKVRGVKGGFEKAWTTIQKLKESEKKYADFHVHLNCTINKLNYNQLMKIRQFARKNDIALGYTFAMITDIYIKSEEVKDNFALEESQKKEVIAFLDELINNPKRLAISRFYFESLKNMIEGNERAIPCIFPQNGCFLEPDGTLRICGTSDKLIFGNIRKKAFTELWDSKKADGARKLAEDKICKKCETNCYVDWSDEVKEKIKKLKEEQKNENSNNNSK